MRLHTDYNVLTELDFIFAKRPSHRLTMVLPRPSNTDGRINIKKEQVIRIRRKKVVPIDVRLGRFYLLIITGPNTGE